MIPFLNHIYFIYFRVYLSLNLIPPLLQFCANELPISILCCMFRLCICAAELQVGLLVGSLGCPPFLYFPFFVYRYLLFPLYIASILYFLYLRYYLRHSLLLVLHLCCVFPSCMLYVVSYSIPVHSALALPLRPPVCHTAMCRLL